MMPAPALREVTRATWEQHLHLPPRRTVSECADAERYLSPEYNEGARFGPLRWHTSRVPYLREIMDALGDDEIREVTFVKASQVGGSECGQNWILHTVVDRPAPMLIVWPSITMLKAFSTKRLDPMFRDCPILHGKLPDSGRRDRNNSITSKQFPGGYLQMLTAKSRSQLRSFSAGRLYAEEVDAWEGDVGGEGDPLELLRARGSTYEETFKLFKVSTPTIEGASRIWSEWEASSQAQYVVPCPHCNYPQTLEWQDDQGRYRLICDKDEAGELIAESAQYLCGGCGALIEERWKAAMLAEGVSGTPGLGWQHARPARRRINSGYHANQLYSPIISWAKIVEAFKTTKGDPAKLKAFHNTRRGLPFRAEGEGVQPHVLAARAEEYGAAVPHGVGVLTGFVDVQGDRLELHTWGWGHQEESWVIVWDLFDGSPAETKVWDDLARVVLGPWQHASGAELRIASCAVDTNYHSEMAWRFAETYRGRGTFPTIGRGGRGRPVLQAPFARRTKKVRSESRPKWTVGVDTVKDLMDARLKITERGPGYVHFPTTLDPAFYDQLSAEVVRTVYVNGIPTRRWELIPGRRNEAWDGAVGNYAALAKLGMATINRLGELAKALSASGPGATPPTPEAPRRRVRWPGLQG